MARKTNLIPLAAALLALMAASMAWPLMSGPQPVAAKTSEDTGTGTAKILVKLANQTVDRVLRLAEENNLILPEDLAARINETRSLLEQAYSKAEEDPAEAIKTTLQAMEAFKPVTQYVLDQLNIGPHVSENALVNAIDVHIRLIDSIKEKLNKTAEKHNITVPNEIWEKLDEMEDTLLKVKESLQAGNITISQAAKSLGAIKLMLHKVLREAAFNVSRTAFKARSMGMVVHRISGVVLAAEKAVNATIMAVENNRTKAAEAMLNRTIEAVDKALNTSTSVEVFASRYGIDGGLRDILEVVNNSLIEVKQHLVAARDSLKQGDINKALQELDAAYQKLSELVNYLKDHLKEFRGELGHMMQKCSAAHEKLEKAAKRHRSKRSRP